MRRAPIVLTATAAGVAGILAFHTKQPTSRLATPPAPSRGSSTTTSNPPASTAPRSTTSTTAGGAGGTRTVAGPVEQYAYGQLSVDLTERGGRVTAVGLASLSTAEPYSQSLAEQTAPQLAQEVVAAQSANIQGISGATYTSQAYAQSVQGAIDRMGHP